MCVAIAYVAGIAASRLVGYTPWLWLAAALPAALAIVLRGKGRVALALLLAGMAALGLGRGGLALHAPPLPPLGAWTVEGTVDGEVSIGERGLGIWLRDVTVWREEEGGSSRIAGQMYVYYPTDAGHTALAHGQRIRVAGSSYLPSVQRNPGGFDQRMWMAQHGAHVRLYAASAPKVLEGAGFSLRGAALGINAAIGAYMDGVYGHASPVVRAMLLGDQGQMPQEWSDWMRQSGIVHLLAVSGLHVGLWFMLLDRALRPLPVSPRVRWVLLAVVLAAYALITGLKPSVLRATIMLLAVQGSHVAKRKADPLTNVALAALVILLVRPLDLFGAGFQLSFCAVLGIVLLRPALAEVLRVRPAALGETLHTTLAAQLGILPAMSAWYGTTSLLGVLANLVAVPLAGLLIPVAALGAALHAAFAWLGWLPVQAARGMVAVLMVIARWTAGVGFGVIRLGAFAWWTSAAYFAAMGLCCTAVIWRWRARVATMALLAVLAVGIGFGSGSFWVRYVQLDVGQALAGVLHAGGKAYVYDTGDEGSDLTEYLLYTGSAVEAVFLSHPHTDHVGGLTEAVEAGIPIRTIYVPENADAFGAEPYYESRLALAEATGAQVVAVQAGDTLGLGGVQATVIAPDAQALRGSDPNDRSLVLLLEIGKHRLLLMGDADGAAEPLGVDTDVLQVAHHGSRNAAREAFLADATPDIALVSVGRNSYGHPNAETLLRLEDAGATVYTTQESGALTLYFEPETIRVEAYVR